MAEIKIGLAAPDFSLPATGGTVVSLSDYRNRTVILFFYPKDNTAGWTDEAREFRDIYPEATAAGAVILGVSRDSIASHERFSAKLELPYLLLADTDSAVCQLYGVLKEKNMYGKKVVGIERSTFIIGPDGRIAQVFRGVKVAGHARAVLAALDF